MAETGTSSANANEGDVAPKISDVKHTVTGKKKAGAKKANSTALKQAEARRLKRNAYSRKWKKDHKKKVKTWNKAWAVEQRGDKKQAKTMRDSVRGPKGNDQPVRKAGKKRVPKVAVPPVEGTIAA